MKNDFFDSFNNGNCCGHLWRLGVRKTAIGINAFVRFYLTHIPAHRFASQSFIGGQERQLSGPLNEIGVKLIGKYAEKEI
jgi:hypothetical protein